MKKLLSAILICSAIFCLAQETTVLDTNPTGAKWYQLKTPGFKILYLKGFEAQAQRMANTLETIRVPEARGMNTLPKRIPIVLQSLSGVSNAFVSLAPRRSEFYTMPPQDYNFVGASDWLNLLAVHEYRHIAQFQRSITGFNKFLFYAFGQEAAAGLAFLTAPSWFWEGDAVATETAFTPGGRGRIPNFDLVFRSNLLENPRFSYNKQYLRSYKYFVPNHYVLGYHMVSGLRKQTGKHNTWGNIAKRAWSFPLPFAFSSAMKREAGQRVVPFYNAMMQELKTNWQNELAQLELSPFESVTHRPTEVYTDFLYPQVLADGSIAALKKGIGDVEQIVIFEEGKAPSKKFVTGPLNETGMLSVAGTQVVWNEYRFDPRWPVKNFSTVVGFDFGMKLKHQVSRKSRYAGAALSPDGKNILTVETDTAYHTSLVVLQNPSGEMVKKIPNPDGAFYSMARWADEGKSIVVLKSTAQGKAVVVIDYQSFTEKIVVPSSSENIGYPVLSGGYLLYNSPLTGIDNIYALELASGKKFQITSAKYGAYNPCLSADGKTLYYNNQGKYGMDVVKTSFDPGQWKPIEQAKIVSFNSYQHLVEQEGAPHLLDSVPGTFYQPKRYHKALRMFNPHSWGGYVNNSLTRVDVGITSKDILSTTQIKAGINYDIQERTHDYRATVSMQALYPIVDFTFKQGKRSADLGLITYVVNQQPFSLYTSRSELKFDWEEQTIEMGLRLPYNLTTSRFFTEFVLSNYVGRTAITDFKNNIDGGGRLFPENYPQFFFESYQDNGTLLYNNLNLSFYSLLKRSTRDLNSKWGYAMYLNSTNTPYNGDFTGKNFSFLNYLYFPGFFKHHSLWGYWGFQATVIKLGRVNTIEGLESNYIFRNQIPLPRGVGGSLAERVYTMSINYALPLWYPDIALGPILNFKRVRVNGFMDYAFGDNPKLRATRPDQPSTYSSLSLGAELKLDLNILRFLPEYDVGFRYSYGPNLGTTRFEVLLGTFNF